MDILAQPAAPSQEETRNRALFKTTIVKGKQAKSVLEKNLTEERLAWLARYAKSRFESYYSSLSSWRNDLDKYMQQSEDYFEWRRQDANRNTGSQSIFSRQNDSLNLVGAFAEFFTAHAQNDLFGSSPWFQAKPQGKADITLADHLSAHANWKLRPTGLTECYREAVALAAVLGTCFTKKTWEVHSDFYECNEPKITTPGGDPVQTTDGQPVSVEDSIAENPDGSLSPEKDPNTILTGDEQIADSAEEKENVIYQNVKGYNLHFRDVAFDRMAPELSLRYTDFFHVFEKSLPDCIADFNLDETGAYRLYTSAKTRTESTKGESYRGETAASTVAEGEEMPEVDGQKVFPNIPIKLCEGYMRLDVNGNGKLSQVYVIFCPELEIILKADYLANVTPEGDLPIHAHTIYKPAWRITGRGFFEKYATTQTFVDDLFNRVNYHDRKSSQPITGIDRTKMEGEDEDTEAQPFDLDKPVNLKPDEKLDEAIQFKVLPDLSDRTTSQLQMMIQMTQLRTGITAASQGEMSSLPETNTATGINQLLSRAAVLLKAPIDVLKSSFTADINYTIKLLYENQDSDETFLFGEGENQELATLAAKDVKDLDIHVELLLSQAQSQTKLQDAQAAIGIFLQWVDLPETEKDNARALFLQALRSLNFAGADQMLRRGVVGIQDALKLLPPDQAQQVMDAMQKAQAPQGGPTKESISMAYKDVPPAIQRQMEAAAGFTPAAPEEDARVKPAPAKAPDEPENVSPMPPQGASPAPSMPPTEQNQPSPDSVPPASLAP